MTKRVLWFSGFSTIALVFLLWFERGRTKKPEPPPQASVQDAGIAAGPGEGPGRVKIPNVRAGPESRIVREYRQGKIDKAQALQNVLSDLNDVPIDFYGKLEDQFGNPVAGAEVTGTTTIINGKTTGAERATVMTDDNGLFEIHAGKGQSIGLMPKKDGYVLSTTSTDFNYSLLSEVHYVPNPANPTVIQMWKLQGAERLISFDIESYVPCDATPTIFDLHTGLRVQDGGDLIIAVQSTNNPSLSDGYYWEAELRAVKGGLLLATNVRPEQMLGAPLSGYSETFSVKYDYKEKPWNARYRASLYFTSRQGQSFGRFSVEILSDVVKDNSTFVRIRGVLNPAGSRNLEIDPNLVSQAHP